MDFEVTFERVVHDVVSARVRVSADDPAGAALLAESMLSDGSLDGLYFEYAREARSPESYTVAHIEAAGE